MGKLRLLRILNGVFSPDEGEAIIRGKVGAMIAAGAGFAPTLLVEKIFKLTEHY